MKKRIFALAVAAVMLLAFVPARVQAQPFEVVTGEEMMARLGLGINIANTLDARAWGENRLDVPGFTLSNPLDQETLWGEVRIEPWHFEAIALKGFDHVRIPVTWENQKDENGRIHPVWMDRVQEVVDMALDAGLYVVLNTMHEYGRDDSLYAHIDMGRMDEAKAWIDNVWGQIAQRFSSYSQALLFEVHNEAFRAVRGGWIWYPDGRIDTALADRVNQINHHALEVIRSSGGNNDRRVVVLSPIGAQADALPYYIHPANDPYTMLGIFYYPPHSFAPIIDVFNAGIPIYIKETAPIFVLGGGEAERIPDAQMIAWITETYSWFADRGIPIAYWNTEDGGYGGGGWPIFSRSTGEWNTPLVNAVFAAHGRTPGAAMTPPVIVPAPFDLGVSMDEGYFRHWNNVPGISLFQADVMVVEHTGGRLAGGYTFVRHYPEPWTQFDDGDPRITEEAGRIIFDLRGLYGQQLALGVWNDADRDRVTRVFLATHAQLGVIQAAAGWAQPYVTTALINRLLPDNLQSNFTNPTTRAEFAQLAVTLYESQRRVIRGRVTFSDTSDIYVEKAAYIGVVSGMGDGTFAPADTLTRAQAAAMMSRLAGAMGAPLPQHTPTFGDTNDFPTWAADYIGQMQASNIMGGLPDGTFAPQDPYTREASITTIVRLLRRLI
jgi:hypothetical protein